MVQAQRAIDFFAEVLRLNGGEFEGLPFILGPWQAFIIGSLFGWRGADGYRRFRTGYMEIGKGNGKALDITTPIPTSDGWRRMVDLQVGDALFDEAGARCRVVGATPVMIGRPCFRVTFSDGETIVADAAHLWRTSSLRSGGRKGPKAAGLPRKGGYAVRTTEEISRTLRTAQGWNHRVDVAGALDCAEAALPIPPYTLGVWLGDGDSAGARLTMAYADGTIAEELRADGTAVDARRSSSATTGRFLLGGRRAVPLQTSLRRAGLLGNKHIPAAYLRGSRAQRLALLQGLMDTDGHAGANTGRCEFTTSKEALRDGALELIRSLGLKPSLLTGRATIYGRDVGPKYRITFTAHEDVPVFRLPRKLARLPRRPATRPISAGRMIVGCEPVASVPVRCIEVDSPSHLFLAGAGMIPTHNSPLAAGIGMYCLMSDGEQRAEIYAAATKKDQAMILFRDAVAMRDLSPQLSARLVKTGGANCWNLAYPKTASFFRAIASDDGQSGPRPHCSLIDEVHEHPNALVIDMLSLGQKGRRQPLTIEITNSGFDRTSICYQHHEYSARLLRTGETNDQWFAYVCGLDDGDDPLADTPAGRACWAKANPNLGVSIRMDYLEKEVREARGMPAKASKVRRLNFCQWVDAENPWIAGPLWLACEREMDGLEELAECEEVVAALDLSGTRDLSAMALAGDKGGRTVARCEFWTPGDTAEERSRTDRVPYTDWIARGFLNAPPGRGIDYGFIAQRLAELQVLLPNFRRVAFDPYRIKYLEVELDQLGVAIILIPHPQGYYKAAAAKKDADGNDIPGLWMPHSVELLEKAVNEATLDVEKNPVLTWNSASAVLEADPKNNRIFTKRRSRGRIDGIVALTMAVGLLREEAAEAPVEHRLMFV